VEERRERERERASEENTKRACATTTPGIQVRTAQTVGRLSRSEGGRLLIYYVVERGREGEERRRKEKVVEDGLRPQGGGCV